MANTTVQHTQPSILLRALQSMVTLESAVRLQAFRIPPQEQ